MPPPVISSTLHGLDAAGFVLVIPHRESGTRCGLRQTLDRHTRAATHVRQKGRFGNRLGDSVGQGPLSSHLLLVLALLLGTTDGLEGDHSGFPLSAGLQFSRGWPGRRRDILEFFDEHLVQVNAFRDQELLIFGE